MRQLLVLTLLASTLTACDDATYATAAPVDEITAAPLPGPGDSE